MQGCGSLQYQPWLPSPIVSNSVHVRAFSTERPW